MGDLVRDLAAAAGLAHRHDRTRHNSTSSVSKQESHAKGDLRRHLMLDSDSSPAFIRIAE
ncbi:MAG: hypothetical protein ACRDG6_03925 [Candidatus Limnocylindria bacterium]